MCDPTPAVGRAEIAKRRLARHRARALELVKLGVMRASGLREIDRAKADGRWERAYAAASTAKVPDDLRAALGKNKKAAAFFETLNARNRYAILYRKAETRAARIAKFVAMLAKGETILQLHGIGPFQINYVNPTDDPRKKADGK